MKVKKSRINGVGLYATQNIKKGELVDHIQGDIHVFRTISQSVSKKMVNWIGVGRYSWIDTSTSPFRFINHSCDPNVYIKGKRTVVAKRNIAEGEEITMDYSLTEAEEGWCIEKCSCKSKNCRGYIGPVNTLDMATFKKNKSYIPKPFQKIYLVDRRKLMHN